MAARLFHLRRLLQSVQLPAFPSSAAFPPPSPYAVLGQPRRLSTQTPDLLPRYDDGLNSDARLYTLAFIYFYCGARTADSRVRHETAINQHLKSKIERMDYEIRALEEARRDNVHPVEE